MVLIQLTVRLTLSYQWNYRIPPSFYLKLPKVNADHHQTTDRHSCITLYVINSIGFRQVN